MESRNPATDEVIWEGKSSTPAELDQAIALARKTFPAWRATPIGKRIEILERFAEAVDLADLIGREMGKPLWEAKTEVAAMKGKIPLSIAAQEERADTRKGPGVIIRHHPHGVLGVLGPFNFPGHLPNGHIVPALLAGNTVVFKPSELTPAVGAAMVQTWREVGLPEGVLNLVQGGSEIGHAMVEHDGLDGLLFTGSASVGHAIDRAFDPHKILALEMGGNGPLVVWEAADLKAAAYMATQSAYITSGQRCSCARRLIVERDSELPEKLAEMIGRITIGPYDQNPFMGPLVSRAAADKMGHAQARISGKTLVKMEIDGAFVTPGLIEVEAVEDVEHFGPLLQVVRVDSFEAAIAEANRTAYGLSAGLLSDNPSLYQTFSDEVRAGIINWNRPTTGASGAAPFGGIGLSGNHRPSGYYAVDYCNYPVASIEAPKLALPETPTPGLAL